MAPCSHAEDKAGYIVVLGLVVPVGIVPADTGNTVLVDIGLVVESNLVGEAPHTAAEVAHTPGAEGGPCIAAVGWTALGVLLPTTLLPPSASSSCYE